MSGRGRGDGIGWDGEMVGVMIGRKEGRKGRCEAGRVECTGALDKVIGNGWMTGVRSWEENEVLELEIDGRQRTLFPRSLVRSSHSFIFIRSEGTMELFRTSLQVSRASFLQQHSQPSSG